MESKSKDKLTLFLTGLVQVFLVAINTYQIAHEKWIGCMVVGFLISYVWTWNVRKVAFGSHSDRIIYSLGASTGTALGLTASWLFYRGL